MCKSPLHPLLASLPKCEHHVHLEGCLTADLLFRLAERNSVVLPSLPMYSSAAALLAQYNSPDAYDCLQTFLDILTRAVDVLRTEADFYDLGLTYFRHAAADNVRHAEVFFSFQGHALRGMPFETVIAGYSSAAAEAERTLNMTVKLIPCFIRHFSTSEALTIYEKTLRPLFKEGVLGGIGVAGPEKLYPPELFTEVYKLAASDGVPRTAHAGEEGPPAYVYSALDSLQVSRVDHGRASEEDPELMARLAASNTTLTLCPLSNFKLAGVKAVADLPVRTFLDKGVKFSINSDDPAYFGGWTLDNYCAVQDAFGLSVEEWERICGNAIEGSWCDEKRKGELRAELEGVLGDWRKKNAIAK